MSSQLPCASSCYCYTAGVHTIESTNNSIDGPSIPASAARRRARPQAPARDGWRVGATTATRRPCRLTRDGQVSGCTLHEPQHARYAARAAPHLAPRGVGYQPRARLSQRPRTARAHLGSSSTSSLYACETPSARRQAEWVACARRRVRVAVGVPDASYMRGAWRTFLRARRTLHCHVARRKHSVNHFLPRP